MLDLLQHDKLPIETNPPGQHAEGKKAPTWTCNDWAEDSPTANNSRQEDSDREVIATPTRWPTTRFAGTKQELPTRKFKKALLTRLGFSFT